MNRRLLPWINFRAYRKSIYLWEVFVWYGRETLTRRPSYARGSCPICQTADKRSRVFLWNFEKCAFYCFACKAKGDAIELLRRIKRCSIIEAAKWLERRGGPSGSGIVVDAGGRCATSRT